MHECLPLHRKDKVGEAVSFIGPTPAGEREKLWSLHSSADLRRALCELTSLSHQQKRGQEKLLPPPPFLPTWLQEHGL